MSGLDLDAIEGRADLTFWADDQSMGALSQGAAHVRMLLRKRLGDTATYYQTRGFEDLLRAEAREGDIIEKLREWAKRELDRTSGWDPMAVAGERALLGQLETFLNDLQEQSTGTGSEDLNRSQPKGAA